MSSLALQEVLSVLVELQIGDLDLRGVNTDLGGGSVHLIAGDSLDVDDPLLSVDLRHLALLALEGAASHLHLIALDHGNGVDLEMRKGDESSRCTYPSEPCSEEKTSSDGGCEKEPRNEPYGKYGEKKRHKDYNQVNHRNTIRREERNHSYLHNSHIRRDQTRRCSYEEELARMRVATYLYFILKQMNWYIHRNCE